MFPPNNAVTHTNLANYSIIFGVFAYINEILKNLLKINYDITQSTQGKSTGGVA